MVLELALTLGWVLDLIGGCIQVEEVVAVEAEAVVCFLDLLRRLLWLDTFARYPFYPQHPLWRVLLVALLILVMCSYCYHPVYIKDT